MKKQMQRLGIVFDWDKVKMREALVDALRFAHLKMYTGGDDL